MENAAKKLSFPRNLILCWGRGGGERETGDWGEPNVHEHRQAHFLPTRKIKCATEYAQLVASLLTSLDKINAAIAKLPSGKKDGYQHWSY